MSYQDIGLSGYRRSLQVFDPTDPGLQGLSGATANKVIDAGGAIGGSAVSGAIAVGAIGGPMGIAIAAGITGLVVGLKAIFNRKGPEQKKAATKIAEDAWALMQDNLNSFMQSARTAGDKQIALARFDELYGIMQQAFSHPELGSHGARAIEERKPGGIYDSHRDYRKPIEDTPIVSDSDAWGNYIGSSLGMDLSGSKLLLFGGIGLLVLAAVMED